MHSTMDWFQNTVNKLWLWIFEIWRNFSRIYTSNIFHQRSRFMISYKSMDKFLSSTVRTFILFLSILKFTLIFSLFIHTPICCLHNEFTSISKFHMILSLFAAYQDEFKIKVQLYKDFLPMIEVKKFWISMYKKFFNIQG